MWYIIRVELQSKTQLQTQMGSQNVMESGASQTH